MATLDRYLFRQLLWSSLGLLVVVFCIVFLAQSIRIVETVAQHGKGLRLFAELAALLAPPILALALPTTGFVGVVHTLYRLHSNSEIAAIHAAGVGPYRLLPSVLRFAILISLLTACATLYLSPVASRVSQERLSDLRNDLGVRLLQDGRFLNPSTGVTVFVRRIDRNQVMHNVFVHDAHNPNAATSYVAQRAQLEWNGPRPQLIMFEGSAYTVDSTGQQIGLLRYDQFIYDLSGLLQQRGVRFPRPHELFVTELFDPELATQSEHQRRSYRLKGHEQLSAPLYALALPFLALAGLLGGRARPTISTGRILATVSAGLALFVSAFATKAAALASSDWTAALYLLPVAVLLVSILSLALSGGRPRVPA